MSLGSRAFPLNLRGARRRPQTAWRTFRDWRADKPRSLWLACEVENSSVAAGDGIAVAGHSDTVADVAFRERTAVIFIRTSWWLGGFFPSVAVAVLSVANALIAEGAWERRL